MNLISLQNVPIKDSDLLEFDRGMGMKPIKDVFGSVENISDGIENSIYSYVVTKFWWEMGESVYTNIILRINTELKKPS